MSRDSADRLRDILDCIRKVRNADALLQQGDRAGDREVVETAFAAVERNLFVIGEAAKDLPDDVLALAPAIDWKAVKGLRDVLGHESSASSRRSFTRPSGETSTRWRLP
ncbi:MAG TPA: HepT-like ribonuclease domain-containing protein [Dermatophilaceae bacterium]|nr:HepT-like ribonuclease domain-containing protein [Dermatophilaceae bacterium]